MTGTSRLSLEDSKFLTRVMTMGTGTKLPVLLSESEIVKLIAVIYHDNGKGEELEAIYPGLWAQINPAKDYYDIDNAWFMEPIKLNPFQHVALIQTGKEQIQDFVTYLRCLSEIHKRRRKYALILAAQPLPSMIQVSPRSLVEYGSTTPEALASWLTWRKFFYDLDNRSAQETGYLFEPILAAAIGGEPKSARDKVVRRSNEDSKGRQVDCWKVTPDGHSFAYEFKLRVTIAASGQGRFAEELSFAEDCESSGATPILIVLDPTMNPRLEDLQAAYEARGGKAFLGVKAWEHLEEQAGDTMSKFIEKYVRQPVAAVSAYEAEQERQVKPPHENLLPLSASYERNELILKLGSHERRIVRAEDRSLEQDEDEGDVT